MLLLHSSLGPGYGQLTEEAGLDRFAVHSWTPRSRSPNRRASSCMLTRRVEASCSHTTYGLNAVRLSGKTCASAVLRCISFSPCASCPGMARRQEGKTWRRQGEPAGRQARRARAHELAAWAYSVPAAISPLPKSGLARYRSQNERLLLVRTTDGAFGSTRSSPTPEGPSCPHTPQPCPLASEDTSEDQGTHGDVS